MKLIIIVLFSLVILLFHSTCNGFVHLITMMTTTSRERYSNTATAISLHIKDGCNIIAHDDKITTAMMPQNHDRDRNNNRGNPRDKGTSSTALLTPPVERSFRDPRQSHFDARVDDDQPPRHCQ